jgi:hypothetical protein
MKPFYIDGLTASSYHAAPGWSSSQIRLLPDKPLRFRNRYLCRRTGCLLPVDECQCSAGPLFDRKPPSDAMKLGTAVHRVLLDGCDIEVIPRKLLTASGARPTGAKTLPPLLEWEAEHRDSVHVACEDSPLHRMVDAVQSHPICGPMIADPMAVKERSIWWVDDETGLLCKARVDWWLDGRLIDLKTTKAPRPEERDFSGEIAAYELHRQLLWYADAAIKVDMPVRAVGFIAVGNSDDYECWEHGAMPLKVIELGETQNIEARHEIAERLDSGEWYPDGYNVSHETGPAEWYMKKHE